MDDIIRLAHGSGGKLTHALIEQLFVPYFANPSLDPLDDSALIELEKNRIAFTTDSYVVDPIFFPGGDIGRLAVCGTVNDLLVQGAKPVALSAGFILEEGLPTEDLKRVIVSMADAAREANVVVATGDTKVVASGAVDKIFITTSGVGELLLEKAPSGHNAEVGDAVLVSGTVGDHGMAVMVTREGIEFDSQILSDVAPLSPLVSSLIKAGCELHTMRDPTRGGLATTVNEIARASDVTIELFEKAIPVAAEVAAACELLGFDPLYVANEGKLVLFVPAAEKEKVLALLRAHPQGAAAAEIGTVVEAGKCGVHLRTAIGGSRIVDMMVGEQLPRIC